jgi:cytochrome c-type biogenesis protein
VSSVGQFMTSGPVILALPVAAAAGAITFLSPCCLPLVSGYLSFVTGMTGIAGPSPTVTRQASPAESGTSPGHAPHAGLAVATRIAVPAVSAPPRGRVVAGTALFVLGFSAVFVVYGMALGGLGHLLSGHARLLTQVFGGLTILLGLLFAGVFDRFAFAGRIARPAVRPRAGLAGAPLLGVMFGLGWTPCTGPTMSAVLALSASTGTAARGALLAFVYALGVGVPFLLASAGFRVAMRTFAFARRRARLVTTVGGVMLVCVGLLEVTGAWSSFMAWLQVHWFSYQPPF